MLGPGIGGFELVIIAIVALVVVGPKDLPMLMRKIGKLMGKARRMADEFRASFDEMARQSELDELRKEVEALRAGTPLKSVEDSARKTFSDIDEGLNDRKPFEASWDEPPVMTPLPPAAGPDPYALPELAGEPMPAPSAAAEEAEPAPLSDTPARPKRKRKAATK